MTDPGPDLALSRTAASQAVQALGWRLLLTTLAVSYPATSLRHATETAALAATACGQDADGHLRADVRADRVTLFLQTLALGRVTRTDTRLAEQVSDAAAAAGLSPESPTSDPDRPAVQLLEIAIDALDIPAVRPFWAAVLGYRDEPQPDGPSDNGLVDPTGHLPSLWFQQMDAERPQRNRIHLDITVPHDEAQARVQAALDAGGRLLDDSFARSFWVLADAEGNEVCVCTWLDRDERRERETAAGSAAPDQP